jgi:hypothetical protein
MDVFLSGDATTDEEYSNQIGHQVNGGPAVYPTTGR